MSASDVFSVSSPARFAAVKRAIDEVDPMGLLAAGAPGDEYEAEAAEIAGLPQEELTLERLEAIMGYWFGPDEVSAEDLARLHASLSSLRP